MENFKTEYKKEEIEELTAWFAARADRLPQQLQISESTFSEDLPKTVRALTTAIRRKRLTVTFCGYVSQLYTIRKLLQDQGLD